MSSPHQPILSFLFMRQTWFEDAVEQRTGAGRVEEVVQSIAETLAVSCPFCLTMMSDGLVASDSHVQVRDISELLLEALG